MNLSTRIYTTELALWSYFESLGLEIGGDAEDVLVANVMPSIGDVSELDNFKIEKLELPEDIKNALFDAIESTGYPVLEIHND